VLADVVVTKTVVEFVTATDSVMTTVAVVVFVLQMVSVVATEVTCATDEELCVDSAAVIWITSKPSIKTSASSLRILRLSGKDIGIRL